MAARPEKVAVVDEVKASLDGAVATILTDYRGLSVGELAQLRIELRKANASYKVAKNTLMRRAADEAQVAITDLLVGPTALVFCEEDPVGPAKALKAFAKDHPDLVVKGSWLDGELLDAEQTIKLADLESREELLAKLAGLMYGALANTARLLNAAPTKLAQLMAALEAEGGVEAKGFSPTGSESAPADEAPADDAPADDAPADEPEVADATDDATDASAESSDDATEDAEGGVAAAAASAVDAVADVAGTVTDAATDVVETAAAVTAGAAETVADVAESAAEAVAPDEPEASDDEPEATTDDEPEATTDDVADDEPEASDEPEAAEADDEPAADDETDQA